MSTQAMQAVVHLRRREAAGERTLQRTLLRQCRHQRRAPWRERRTQTWRPRSAAPWRVARRRARRRQERGVGCGSGTTFCERVFYCFAGTQVRLCSFQAARRRCSQQQHARRRRERAVIATSLMYSPYRTLDTREARRSCSLVARQQASARCAAFRRWVGLAFARTPGSLRATAAAVALFGCRARALCSAARGLAPNLWRRHARARCRLWSGHVVLVLAGAWRVAAAFPLAPRRGVAP